ncbi:hypothetical protein AN214_03967 [Pseudoalteromonas sp. P1-9]|nr:hypothetical protein AN214_03967 [Pseudoalteromonas sp. P1-9]
MLTALEFIYVEQIRKIPPCYHFIYPALFLITYLTELV